MGAKTREKFHSCLYNFKTSPRFTLLPELTLGNAVSHYQLPYHLGLSGHFGFTFVQSVKSNNHTIPK